MYYDKMLGFLYSVIYIIIFNILNNKFLLYSLYYLFLRFVWIFIFFGKILYYFFFGLVGRGFCDGIIISFWSEGV